MIWFRRTAATVIYLRLVQFVSGWVAFCHLVLGAAGLLGDAQLIAALVRLFYGASLEIDLTLFYVAKLLAVYFLAFGALALAITVRPGKYLNLVPIVVAFFVIRLGELIWFYRVIGEEFLVADNRLIEKIVSFAIIAAVLAFAAYRVRASYIGAAAQAR
jgi:hypothetical protein